MQHTIDTPKYLKKTITETAWTQPILSANGTIGGNSFAVYKSHDGSTGGVEAYKAFDGNIDTITQWSQVANSYILFYNPIPLKVSQVKAIWYGSPYSPSYVYLEGSNDNNSYTVLAEGGSLTMTTQTFTVNTNNAYKYFRLRITGGQNWIDLREVYITATQQTEVWQECTKAEYEEGIKYYKKTIEYEPFVQPILTTDIPLGGSQFAAKFVGTGYSGTYYGYQAFDKNTSTAVRPYPVSESNYLEFYNPNPLKITRLSCPTAFSNEGITSGGFYGSNDDYNWEYICEIGGGQTWTTNVETDKFYKYFKIVPTVVLGSVGAIAELEITATELVETFEPITKAQYDLLPENERYKDTSGSKRINQANNVKTVKYLQETEMAKQWEQPTLTSAGTMGGNSFAVSGIVYQSSRAVWNMFDNNDSTIYDPADSSWHDVIFTIYNPKPICVTQVEYIVGGYYQSKVQVQGSNDNSTWNNLGTYNLASGSTQTANITNTQFFKYYKFTGKGYSMIIQCNITATQQTTSYTAGTSSNYDLIIPQKHTVNVPKYLKKTVTETAFEQPILSSAGKMGGDSFAVQVSSTYGGSSFQLFDNNTSTYWDAGSRPNWWTFYNPIPLKVSKITTYSANAAWTDTSYKVEASNDNANWVLIKQGSIAQANTQVFEINSTGYYKYYRYTALAGGVSSNPVYEVYITATQQTETWSTGTKDDYDLIK